MDTFFTILKKSLVATMFVVFGLAATYVPQDWNKVELAHAGGAGDALESTQMKQFLADKAFQAASLAKETIIAFATNSLWVKEYVLDGIAWAVAKTFISSLISSLLDWINSGFKGRPMFVTDLSDFLLYEVADKALGEYSREIGGIGSFICEPFRLDARIAVEAQYRYSRIDQPTPECTVTGIIDNLEGFLSGAPGSFHEGGWDDWFDISQSPEIYTPYGAVLSAQAGAHARIINARGEAFSIIDFGDGFLSGEICQMVQGADTTKEECFISKPGKVIVESLNNHLNLGNESLVTADEIDEVLAAILSQLATKVFTGAAGLLGLSGGTGYTDSGYSSGSYSGDLNQSISGNFDVSQLTNTIQDDIQTANDFNAMATTYLPLLQNSFSTEAFQARVEAQQIINKTGNDATTLQQMLTELNNPATSADRALQIADAYTSLNAYSRADMNNAQARWDQLLN